MAGLSASVRAHLVVLLMLQLLLGWEDRLTCLADCPDECSCKWKNGKQTVECVNASLKAIPEVFDADTQVLDLSKNFIPVLPERIFVRLELPNLQKVFISQSSVRRVEDHCFR